MLKKQASYIFKKGRISVYVYVSDEDYEVWHIWVKQYKKSRCRKQMTRTINRIRRYMPGWHGVIYFNPKGEKV